MTPRRRARAFAFATLLAVAGLPSPHAFADHGGRRDQGWRHEHDAVREAVERGEIKPLAQLLELVKGKLPGDITGVEIERKHGIWLYEFRVIDKEGRLFEVYVDAQSGDIRRTKEK